MECLWHAGLRECACWKFSGGGSTPNGISGEASSRLRITACETKLSACSDLLLSCSREIKVGASCNRAGDGTSYGNTTSKPKKVQVTWSRRMRREKNVQTKIALCFRSRRCLVYQTHLLRSMYCKLSSSVTRGMATKTGSLQENPNVKKIM